MAIYSYTNNSQSSLVIGARRFGPGEEKTFVSSQQDLDNGLIGSSLIRKVDGVVDNNPFDDGQSQSTAATDLNTLLSGEDQVNNWLGVTNAASSYQYHKGLVAGDTTTHGTLNGSNGVLLGAVGAANDYLSNLAIAVSTSAQSRVALQDVASVNYTSAGTGTAFTSATTVNFGVSSAPSAAQLASMVDQFLVCTVTIGTSQVQVARKILAAVAGPGTSPNFNVTLTLDSLTVAGTAATAMASTAGQAFITPLIEILPAGAPIGTISLPLNMRSKFGGWRIFVDTGVSVIATGRFA